MELVEIVNKNESVDARDLYGYVFKGQDKKTAFNVWFSRAVNKYDFEEGKDFQSFMIKSTGGRPKVDYAVTKHMGKELCMVAPTENGKKVRDYFIRCEEIAKEAYAEASAIKLLSKHTRKSLTDSVQESGENERMHGHGYSTYTKMVYEICGLKVKYEQFKKDWPTRKDFRDTQLDSYQLKRVEMAESLIKPLLELEKQYSEIKETLKPLFKIEKGSHAVTTLHDTAKVLPNKELSS